MRQNSKAMVTTSLSWMIMVIIGAFFIIFAYSVIQNYQDIEQEKFNLELESTLNHVFTLIGQSTGSETNSLQKLNTLFQDRRVEMFCREGLPTLAIDGDENPNNQFLRNYPVFMSVIEQQKTDESYIAVENFNLPFTITPLLGIVSKKNLYIIDSNNVELAEIFREKFNEFSSFSELNVEFIDISDSTEVSTLLDDVEDQNLNSISFLSDDTYGEDHLSSFLDEISFYGSYVQIDYEEFRINEQIHHRGTINFVDSTEEDFTPKNYSFLDWKEQFALPTMALFSKPQTFDCSYSILQDNINQTYYYYQIKAQQLQEFSKSKQHCVSSISLQGQALKYDLLNKTLDDARSNENFMNLSDYSVLERLISRHNSVVQDSCIYLY